MADIDNYIMIMIDGLKKKLRLLEQISEINISQKAVLELEDFDVDMLEDSIEQKSSLIEQLNVIDNGFEAVYDKIKEELIENKDVYKNQIQEMKDLIRQVTDLSVTVQNSENRNRELIQSRFATMRKEMKESKKSSQHVADYYKTMSKLDSSPQFMDQKK